MRKIIAILLFLFVSGAVKAQFTNTLMHILPATIRSGIILSHNL